MQPMTDRTIRRRAATMILATLLVGCGTSGSTSAPSSPAVGSSASASAPASPSASVSATPAGPSTVPPIDPGTVAEEGPLKTIWAAAGMPAKVGGLGIPGIDAEGRIWVLAPGTPGFWIFDRTGHFVEAWGTAGRGDGQFDFKTGSDTFGDIAFAKDGGFYVSEVGNHRVQQFDKDRKFVAKWGSFGTGDDQFVVPDQIELDGAGNVYVHDDEVELVKEFTPDGTFIRTFGDRSYPIFHADEAGHVYTASFDTNVLQEQAADGHVVRSIDLTGLVSFVSGIQVDAKGDLWVASNKDASGISYPDRLLELDPDGHLLHDWKGMGIGGLALDPAGDRLYASFYAPDLLTAYAVPSE